MSGVFTLTAPEIEQIVVEKIKATNPGKDVVLGASARHFDSIGECTGVAYIYDLTPKWESKSNDYPLDLTYLGEPLKTLRDVVNNQEAVIAKQYEACGYEVRNVRAKYHGGDRIDPPSLVFTYEVAKRIQ